MTAGAVARVDAMVSKPRFAALLLAAGLLCTPVRANDSVAELDAGGLVLRREPGIVLASEDLSIALDRITVSYVFRNQTAEARTVRIAFPLPPINGLELGASPMKLPYSETANFVGFTVTVNGRPLEPELEERAFVDGREVTDLLRRHGLPLNPLRFEAIAAAEKRMGQVKWADLVKAGLVSDSVDLPGGLWLSEAKFHWLQTFPPGEEVRITHSYAPVSGNHPLATREPPDKTYRADYCLDDATLNGLRRLGAKSSDPLGYVGAYVVPYIVTTARNWAAPIGRFTLTVDKGTPDAIVSLCRPGIRKTGPTTFGWEARDYVPDHDLRVLFVLPGPGPMGIR